MVSNPIIPEEMLKRIRPIVMFNKNNKTGPRSIAAWIREACEAKLNPRQHEVKEFNQQEPPEPMPAEERIG